MLEFVKQYHTSVLELQGWLACWCQLFKQFYQQGWIVISFKYKNFIFIGKPFLIRQNRFERKLKSWTEIVGTKLRTVQWSGINSTTCWGVNTDRCLNKGLGEKCNILKNLESQSHASPGGQHGSFDISIKDEDDPEFKISPISKRNMGLSSPIWDHFYSRVPSHQTGRDSRLGVKRHLGLLKWKLARQSFQRICQLR